MLQAKDARRTARHTLAWGCREGSTEPADPTTHQQNDQNQKQQADDNNLRSLHLLVGVEKSPSVPDVRHASKA